VSEPLAALRSVCPDGWLVGGALRDRLLGRATFDYDVVVPADGRRAARALGRACSAHSFELSEGFGAWRVIARDRSWQVDILPVEGDSIEADLARRDFTINAIAEPLRGGELMDPFGGVEDLRGRRLRMVSPGAFAADPLRTLRLARLACELEFDDVDDATLTAARESAGALTAVAGERVFAELKRVVISDRALGGLALMDTVGATDAILPELTALRGVEQSPYHHLDVLDHTRAVLRETVAVTDDGEGAAWLGEHGSAVAELLAEPLANELTRGQALRFGALFHDIAKPQTRSVTSEGRVTFIGHDALGAEMARDVLARLRTSERLADYVAGLVRHHLVLGFLVHATPLDRRAIYRYLRACEPVEVEVTLLSVADRLATRGRGADEAIARHLELARQLLGEALHWRREPPRPPVDGRALSRELGLLPGPEVGRLLAELEEASFAGEIKSSEEALARAREMLGGRAPGEDR